MRLLISACLLWFLSVGVASSGEPDAVPEIDTSGKGAVLCTHSMLALARSFASLCLSGREAEIVRLDAALARFEAFEVKHGGWTPSQATGFTERAGASELGKEQSSCAALDDDAKAAMNALVQEFGSPNSEALVDDMLSVPRKPLMNPCL